MRGEDLSNAIVHNLPRAMFVFLPLLALFMKLLYWRPKRYYVEHLLLLVHNHAFIFLAMTILVLVLISRNPALIRANMPASLGKPFHPGA